MKHYNFEWHKSTELVPYEVALEAMQHYNSAIAQEKRPEILWALEHPSLYTAGTSAKPQDLLDSHDLPVYYTGRGGQFTYHGPGQRIVYTMLNLKKRYAPTVPDIRDFVWMLEEWLIHTLAEFAIKAERREGRVGVWVEQKGEEKKIAALGIRVSKGVSFHGVALNVNPDLRHYQGIVPCGISRYGVTSLEAMQKGVTMQEVDAALQAQARRLFGEFTVKEN